MFSRLLLIFTFTLLNAFASPLLIAAETSIKKNPVATPLESLMPMLGGLVAVLALIFLLAFLFKKFSRFNVDNNSIKIIETQIIGAKEKLMIVAINQQRFLIGVTGTAISQLGELKVEQPAEDELRSHREVTPLAESVNESSNDLANKTIEKPSFASVLGNIVKGKPNPFEVSSQKIRKVS